MKKAVFKSVAPYADDAMNLPVANIDEAIPYYERTFRFSVVSRQETPVRSVVMERDGIQMGLAENGGDSEQEGCFFEVDDLAAAYEEIMGASPEEPSFRAQSFGEVAYNVFFVVAPDGLCYMLGEREK